jgi:hypothetical protein
MINTNKKTMSERSFLLFFLVQSFFLFNLDSLCSGDARFFACCGHRQRFDQIRQHARRVSGRLRNHSHRLKQSAVFVDLLFCGLFEPVNKEEKE